MQSRLRSRGLARQSARRYEAREEQADLADAVAKALEDRNGTCSPRPAPAPGRASLTSSRRSPPGRRVVVATATKALQEQLLTKDVPLAAAALGRDVNVAVLKGRQNYLCRNRLHGFALLGGSLFAEPGGRPRVRRDARPGSTRPRPATAPSSRSSRRTRCGASSPSAPTAASGEPARTSARASPRRRASGRRHADLVIVNHALYFADLGLREQRDGAGVLPEHDAVVFDEAHRLEETAATWLGGRVSGAGLHRLARDVDRACREGERAGAGAGARPRRARRRAASSPPSARRTGRRAAAASRR